MNARTATLYLESLETREVPAVRPNVDLVVQAALTPPTAAINERIERMAITIGNIGTAATTKASFIDRVYLSKDDRFDPGDPLIGQATHRDGTVAPGGTSVVYADLQIPPNAMGGPQFLIIRADAYGAQYDRNRANNFKAFPITLVTSDLCVTDLRSENDGSMITLRWNDRNVGTGAVPNAYTDCIKVIDPTTGSVLLQKEIRVGTPRGVLAPGATATRRFSFPIPPSTSGKLRIVVEANSDGKLTEGGAWRSNNTGTIEISKQAILTAMVQINDGNVQRSSVKSVTVTFDTPIFLNPNAVRVKYAAAIGASPPPGTSVPLYGADVEGVEVNTTFKDGKTVAVLTFRGPGVIDGSLPNGRYVVVVSANRLKNVPGRVFAGDGNGTPGTDLVLPFHRMFGDTNGDGVVDAVDAKAFEMALGKKRGEPGYVWYLDFNSDGKIDTATDKLYFNEWYGRGRFPLPQ